MKQVHVLCENHWRVERYRERMTTKQWSQHLLNGDDMFFAKGVARQLMVKRLGFGVVEVYKKPLKEKA